MGPNFKECSAWVGLVVTAAIFGNFFVEALATPAATFPLLIKAVFASIIWQILLHIVLAIRKPPEAVMERDRAIAGKSRQIVFGVLSAGLFVILGQALFPAWLGRLPILSDVPPMTLIIDLVVATVALGEIARCLTQIILYRRGALFAVSE